MSALLQASVMGNRRRRTGRRGPAPAAPRTCSICVSATCCSTFTQVTTSKEASANGQPAVLGRARPSSMLGMSLARALDRRRRGIDSGHRARPARPASPRAPRRRTRGRAAVPRRARVVQPRLERAQNVLVRLRRARSAGSSRQISSWASASRRRAGSISPANGGRRLRWLESALAPEHRGQRLQQDREIEEDAPALQVEEVEAHQLVEVQLGAARHLPEAGDARAAPGSACGASPRGGRSRAAAAAAGRPSTCRRAARSRAAAARRGCSGAGSRRPRVTRGSRRILNSAPAGLVQALELLLALLGVGVHRAELQAVERLAADARAAAAEQHRAPAR